MVDYQTRFRELLESPVLARLQGPASENFEEQCRANFAAVFEALRSVATFVRSHHLGLISIRSAPPRSNDKFECPVSLNRRGAPNATRDVKLQFFHKDGPERVYMSCGQERTILFSDANDAADYLLRDAAEFYRKAK